jgi:hypothetical protein
MCKFPDGLDLVLFQYRLKITTNILEESNQHIDHSLGTPSVIQCHEREFDKGPVPRLWTTNFIVQQVSEQPIPHPAV